MDLNILGKIMQGGSEKVREAGGVLAGGHSIADSDVKYGLSVTGIIHPDRVFANSGCKEGDALILHKASGCRDRMHGSKDEGGTSGGV